MSLQKVACSSFATLRMTKDRKRNGDNSIGIEPSCWKVEVQRFMIQKTLVHWSQLWANLWRRPSVPSTLEPKEPVPLQARSLFRLSAPILVELLLLALIPIVDLYYMGRISSVALAAISAVLPITGVGMTLFMPLTQAGASVASQHLGARNQGLARITFSTMLSLNLILGSIIGLTLAIFSQELAQAVGLRGEFAETASVYLRILGLGYVFLALKMACSSILNALGQTHLNMWIALLMNLLNLVFNHLFITGVWGIPQMGVVGIAIATLLAWFAAFLLGLFFTWKHLEKSVFTRSGPRPSWNHIKPILRIGVPSAIEPFSYQFSQVVVSGILVQLGIISVTAKALVANVTLFSLLWSLAFAGGAQIKIAYFIGERSTQQAHRQLIEAVKIALLGCTILSLLLALFGPQVLGIFTKDQEVIRVASQILWIAIVLEWGRALNVIAGAALRASGDAKFVAAFGLFSMWTIATLGSYFFGLKWGLGIFGIWMMMTLDEHIRGWVSLRRWYTGKWQSKTLYQ